MIAIRCGVKAAAARTFRALPSDGGMAGGDCGMVHPTGLQWKRLSASTVWKYNKTPEGNCFFLWKDLGRGASGRAFLACDIKGRACILKFFLYDDTVLRHQTLYQLALEAKIQYPSMDHPWTDDLPKHILFLNYVLNYANLNEARTNWRPLLVEALKFNESDLWKNDDANLTSVVTWVNTHL
jgi:hypothetical protein